MITIATHNFEGPYETTASLRNRAGIYVILDYRSDRKWHLLDVGESATIKTRIENHERQSCWEQNRQGVIGVAVLYIPISSANQRRFLEAAIRQQYWVTCGER